MRDQNKPDNESIAKTLSDRYSYEDIVGMQKSGEQLVVSEEDVRTAAENKPVITKDTPNPYGKRILIGFLILIAAIILSIILKVTLGDEGIADYISSVGIGLASVELAPSIIGYFRFNKLKKRSSERTDDMEVS